MFNFRKRKLKGGETKFDALEPVKDREAHLGHIKKHRPAENRAILHACVWLEPKTFDAVIGDRSKVPFEKWYKLLWYIQHEPKTPNSVFSQRLGLSELTVGKMRNKLKQVIYEAKIVAE